MRILLYTVQKKPEGADAQYIDGSIALNYGNLLVFIKAYILASTSSVLQTSAP